MIKLRRILTIALVLFVLLIIATPVFAAADPDEIWFGTKDPLNYVRVYENVGETDDMLFLIESWVKYDPTPEPGTPGSHFIFEVRNAAGTTVIISRPLQSYGERPMSIYVTAAQVTTLGLVSGSAYVIRLTGNPLIFTPPVEGDSMVNYTLSADDWLDQSTATAETNLLRIACIGIAEHMEEEDAVSTYLITAEGVQYLTPTGASLFLAGVPSLDVWVPSLFQITTEVLRSETPDATGSYVGFLTIRERLGDTTADAVLNIGVWLGVSVQMAAGLIMMTLMVLLSIWLYNKTQSGKVVMVLGIAAVMPVATFLGLSSMVIMFILVIMIVLLLGYYFLTRGSL